MDVPGANKIHKKNTVVDLSCVSVASFICLLYLVFLTDPVLTRGKTADFMIIPLEFSSHKTVNWVYSWAQSYSKISFEFSVTFDIERFYSAELSEASCAGSHV